MITTRLQTPSRRTHARTVVMLLASALVLWSIPAFAQSPSERLNDEAVKKLIAQVDEGRDKFEGNLDGQFKGSTLRGPNGETKIAGALQDYQDSTKKLMDRFTADYSASAEVATVLKQSTSIDTFMQKQATSMKGRTEWDRQVANLESLAAAYGATFPFPEGTPVRRMNDKETAAVAASLASAADRYKRELDKAKTLPKADKDAAKKDIEAVIKTANTVESRTGDGKPAATDVRQLAEQVAKFQTFVDANTATVAPTSWKSVQTALGTLQEAFGVKQ